MLLTFIGMTYCVLEYVRCNVDKWWRSTDFAKVPNGMMYLSKVETHT